MPKVPARELAGPIEALLQEEPGPQDGQQGQLAQGSRLP